MTTHISWGIMAYLYRILVRSMFCWLSFTPRWNLTWVVRSHRIRVTSESAASVWLFLLSATAVRCFAFLVVNLPRVHLLSPSTVLQSIVFRQHTDQPEDQIHSLFKLQWALRAQRCMPGWHRLLLSPWHICRRTYQWHLLYWCRTGFHSLAWTEKWVKQTTSCGGEGGV